MQPEVSVVPNWFMLLMLIVAGVLLYSVVAAVAIAWRCGLGKRAGEFSPVLGTLAWVVPAGAVVGWLALQARPYFEDQERSRDSTWAVGAAVAAARGSAEAEPLEEGDAAQAVTLAADDSAPVWVRQRAVRLNSGTLFVLTSKQYATIEQGDAELLPTVHDLIQRYFHSAAFEDLAREPDPAHPPAAHTPIALTARRVEAHAVGSFHWRLGQPPPVPQSSPHPWRGEWRVPQQVLDTAVVQRYVEPIQHDFGRFTGEMYRVHWQVQLAPELRERLYAPWREQIVERRLGILVAFFGLVSLMLSAAAIYYRLDSLTAGAYRLRLKFAAFAVMAAGSLAMSHWLA